MLHLKKIPSVAKFPLLTKSSKCGLKSLHNLQPQIGHPSPSTNSTTDGFGKDLNCTAINRRFCSGILLSRIGSEIFQNNACLLTFHRVYCASSAPGGQNEGSEFEMDKKKPADSTKSKQLQTFDDQSAINRMMLEKYRVPEPTTTAQKVKEGAKDVYYFAVFAFALIIAGATFFYVFRELFSSKSPNSVYGRALKVVCADGRVKEALGSKIKGYGEESGRGRRRHVAHYEYQKDGRNHLRMKFYIKGSSAAGSVNLEVKENESGKYEYRYLYVDLDVFPPKSIILVDNR